MGKDEITALLEQGAHADESIARSCDENVHLRTAHYAGVRSVTLGSFPVRLFAVAVKGAQSDRDVAFARTPELAKLLAQLLVVGEKVFPMVNEAMKGDADERT